MKNDTQKAVKQTKKIALCGVLAALSVVFLFLSRFSPAALAMPAAAGVFLIVCVIEAGFSWALGVYAVVGVLGFLFAQPGSWILYLLFFGCYPILKSVIERIRPRAVCIAVKLAVFGVSLGLSYLIITKLMKIDYIIPDILSAQGIFSRAAVYLVPVLLAGFFLLYDFALTRLVIFYRLRLHPMIFKLL